LLLLLLLLLLMNRLSQLHPRQQIPRGLRGLRCRSHIRIIRILQPLQTADHAIIPAQSPRCHGSGTSSYLTHVPATHDAAQGIPHRRGIQIAHGVRTGSERAYQRRLNLGLLLGLLLRLEGCDQLGDHLVSLLGLLLRGGLAHAYVDAAAGRLGLGGRSLGLGGGWRGHAVVVVVVLVRGLVLRHVEELSELIRRGGWGRGVEVVHAAVHGRVVLTLMVDMIGVARGKHCAGMLLLLSGMLLLLLLLHGLEEGLLEAAVVVGDHGCVIIVVHRVGREVVHRRATRSARVPGIVHGRYVAIVDVAVVAVVLGVCDVDVVNVVRDDDVGVVNVVPNSSTSARSTNE